MLELDYGNAEFGRITYAGGSGFGSIPVNFLVGCGKHSAGYEPLVLLTFGSV